MVDGTAISIDDTVIEQRTISFLGDTLLVLRANSGNFSVSVASLCNALGLDTKGQLQRIKRSPSLSAGLSLLMVETPGGRQRLSCLHSRWISSWLASLRTRKAANLQMSKIDIYQRDLVPALSVSFDRGGDHIVDANPVTQPDILVISPPSSHTIVVDEELPRPEDVKKKMLSILTSLPPSDSTTSHLSSTSSEVDRSLREATFASEDQWEMMDNTYIFSSSNDLQIYLGTPKTPLDIADAQTKIRQLGGSTVLTARVALGLWNLRRHDSRLSVNGSAGVRFDEILAWRGLQKHHRASYPGASDQRTDGYRVEQKQQILRDLEALASCYVRGHCIVTVKGKPKTFYINSSYLHYSIVTTETSGGEEEIVGFFVSPGDWINTYETYTSDFLADIDRRVFAMNAQNEQHELRLALYLVERWREMAAQRCSDLPIVMEELLAASVINPDTQNITRFAARIESGLTRLWQRGILGEEPFCLQPVDKSKGHWKHEWLTAQWRIVPPQDLIERYVVQEKEQRTLRSKKRSSRK
jgi:hypothetical protein